MRNRTPMSVKGDRARSTRFRTDSNDDKGFGDFFNAKNSKYSEGSNVKSGASSIEPDGTGRIPVGSDNENSRRKRNGVQSSNSGPKNKMKSFPFFKHTTKGK